MRGEEFLHFLREAYDLRGGASLFVALYQGMTLVVPLRTN